METVPVAETELSAVEVALSVAEVVAMSLVVFAVVVVVFVVVVVVCFVVVVEEVTGLGSSLPLILPTTMPQPTVDIPPCPV